MKVTYRTGHSTGLNIAVISLFVAPTTKRSTYFNDLGFPREFRAPAVRDDSAYIKNIACLCVFRSYGVHPKYDIEAFRESSVAT